MSTPGVRGFRKFFTQGKKMLTVNISFLKQWKTKKEVPGIHDLIIFAAR